MKKGNLFTRLFFNSKKVITKLHPILDELEKEIKAIEAMNNKVEAMVKLFQVTSPLQDAGGFSQEIFLLNKYASKKMRNEIEALQILQIHLRRAGRDEYGINRTKPGEMVTADKVYLGNVFGLWTKAASYWLSQKERLEKELRPDVSKDSKKPVSTWYLINDYQAGDFVKSHTNSMLQQISVLKTIA